MRYWLAAAAACGILLFAAQARESGDAAILPPVPAAAAVPAAPAPVPDWGEWTRPLGVEPGAHRPAAAGPPDAAPPAAIPLDEEIDVVDAHWMALTMWGEARGQGEDGMRAVGHVIANRWKAKSHGAYVTDTVSAAWQFSCWNANDPNRAQMLAISDLKPGSAGHRQWLDAKRLAAEILAGRSEDPTGGALFYHTTAVQPAWSRGVPPVAQIGDHLFFLAAR